VELPAAERHQSRHRHQGRECHEQRGPEDAGAGSNGHDILAVRYRASDVHLAFKYLIVLLLVLIIASLGKALYHLSSSKPEDSGKMVKALTWRIGLSVGLFVLLIVAYFLGWISPQH
jgi:hypothetical protein